MGGPAGLWAGQSSFKLIGYLDVLETKIEIPQKIRVSLSFKRPSGPPSHSICAPNKQLEVTGFSKDHEVACPFSCSMSAVPLV